MRRNDPWSHDTFEDLNEMESRFWKSFWKMAVLVMLCALLFYGTLIILAGMVF